MRRAAKPALKAEVALAPVLPSSRKEFLRMAQSHFRELNPLFVPHKDWKAEYFERIARNPDFRLRWIMTGRVRAGFMLYGLEGHRFLPRTTACIYELYIVPKLRRKGLARVAAEKAILELQASAASKVQLEIMEGNRAAASLWRSLGFQKVSERWVLAKRAK
jgi:ribosomal protein S18 acetylase RimI-like enzyme